MKFKFLDRFPQNTIEDPESRTGRTLENAYKYCPSRNVTRQISKWENLKIKNTGGYLFQKEIEVL